jgi:twitching motility protein PilT
VEKRRPQDGRIKTRNPRGDEIEMRLSTLPTAFGEKMVMRIFDPDTAVKDLDALGFSAHDAQRWEALVRKPHGVVLVTGPTGSGKTTTLASMLNIINEEREEAHIITIEDPIEYYHKHKKAVVTQREIGVDVPSFAEGLRRALRQDPDIVLVGEMRDLETIEAAITAAETGHLVFGTLHTTGAAKTIDRITNAFPTNQQEMIRIQLSTVMQAVISQLLIPRIDKPGRVAVFEIMVNTPSIAALIRDNKTFRIQSDIQTGAKYGMVTLDSFLVEKYLAGLISREEVVTKAQDSVTVQAKLQELELAQATTATPAG